ncbi:MAG: hypothetical protein PWQ24_1062 [Mesotoga sp.]|nr:hypothetical protein [Mesotoga sp.]
MNRKILIAFVGLLEILFLVSSCIPFPKVKNYSTLTARNLKTAKQGGKMKRKTDVPPQWSIMQSL